MISKRSSRRRSRAFKGFRVFGVLGFRVSGLGFRIQGFGF